MTQNSYEYISPLSDRYNDEEMSVIFSEKRKFTLWRSLWYILAREQKKLGAPITDAETHEIFEAIGHIDRERAQELERQTHHDVMAHLRLLGEDCPTAKPILHLGVTSCYITDNAEVITMKNAMRLIMAKLSVLIHSIAYFAKKYKSLEAVSYTHFQVAQPTTIGKRACLWGYNFMTDYEELHYQIAQLRTLGCKGATGNMSGILCLFDGDTDKARTLDREICKAIGIPPTPFAGQTYSRKQDFRVLQTLSGIAQSASKMATDIRLLSGVGELRESFGESQVGSSAMPYKKNPITCEKIVGLSRYVINNVQNSAMTAASQWLERSLDDSSNRRLVIAESFMATAEILNCCYSVITGLVVNADKVTQNLQNHTKEFLAEFATVKIVEQGGDRQEMHEKLRQAFTSGEDPSYDNFKLPLMKLSGTAEDDVATFIELVRAIT